ncbi:MAG: hypothetical protein ACRDG3_02935, partial [Tepidiformaceae bacterium]
GSPRWHVAGWVMPVALVLITVATLVAVIVLSRVVGNEHLRPEAPPFTYSPSQGYARFSVKEATAEKLTVVGDTPDGAPAPAPQDLVPGPATKIEALQPLDAANIAVGDWVAVIGIPNEVRNFSIHAIVDMPDSGEPGADHVLHSPGGFAGNEASPNAADRVIFGGPVTAIDGTTLTLGGAGGPISLTLATAPPLYRLETVPLSAIHDGDRVSVIGPAGKPPVAILAQHLPAS